MFSRLSVMIGSRVFLLALALLAFANVALAQKEAAEDVAFESPEVDFVENVNTASDNRVVSGWDAHPGQHPHQVNLRLVTRAGAVSGCGGVLIHRLWVASAAHCTANQVTAVVRAGVTSMLNPDYIAESIRFYNYPMYDVSRPGSVQPDDISLIQLRTAVTYTKLAKPIRVQSSADAYREYAGDVAYASGFGRTWTNGASAEWLQWVYLRLVSQSECTRIFGHHITPTSICAGPYNVTSQSVCQGDSGGPLVHVGADGVPTLIGIASFVAGGTHGCHSGFPGVFIRPGPFLGWFREITGIDFEREQDEEEIVTEAPEEPNTVAPTTTLKPDSSEEEPSQEDPREEEEKEVSSEEEEDDSCEDSEEEDPEMKEMLKRLEVQVNVKVKMNKFKKRHDHHHVVEHSRHS